MLGEHLLDLDRVDVLAAGDDQVLDAVADEQEAGLVPVAGIAGAEPGNSLARMEARSLLGRLFVRFPRMRLAGEPERFRSNFINGIRRLPVLLGPAH